MFTYVNPLCLTKTYKKYYYLNEIQPNMKYYTGNSENTNLFFHSKLLDDLYN